LVKSTRRSRSKCALPIRKRLRGTQDGPPTIDGKVVDKGIASRMIAHANAFGGKLRGGARFGGSLLLDQYGCPKLVLDADGNPKPAASSRPR
jgi:hypothetical protein